MLSATAQIIDFSVSLHDTSYHDAIRWRHASEGNALIRSFRGKFAESILVQRRAPKGFSADLVTVARRKLVQINGAVALHDLAIPPGNNLEALKGDLRGKHSIRINDQWRIVFKWTDAGPEDVEITDYH